jgi:hypothetical protein
LCGVNGSGVTRNECVLIVMKYFIVFYSL